MSFDLKVTIRDPKTGGIIAKNPYRLHIQGGSKFYERPVNSGNVYTEDGEPAGRCKPKFNKKSGKQEGVEILPEAEHEAWTAPVTADQAVANQLVSQSNELEALKLELASIKAESVAVKAAAVTVSEAVSQKKSVPSKGKLNA